ncbi:MAG: alpha/beta hydrolase [Ktedonobacteraceae bacterium]|nr:alpha/beta hydrolase [Chloroflexota bacterium]
MTNWFEGEIDANGIRIHYTRTGDHNKPPLVLLHGFLDNGLCWTPVARDLEDRYDVIMLDARGHGQSDGPAKGAAYSFDLLVADTSAAIGALGLHKPYLLGHSMGALTAMALAARAPDLARAIVLEDPALMDQRSPQDEPEQLDQEQLQGIQEMMSFKFLSDEERLAKASALNPNWSREELIPWAQAKVEFDPEVFQYVLASLLQPWRSYIAQAQCPLLLITSEPELGAITTPAMAEEFSHLWRQGEMIHISGAGHCIHRDRYTETMTAIQDFLARH